MRGEEIGGMDITQPGSIEHEILRDGSELLYTEVSTAQKTLGRDNQTLAFNRRI